MKEIYERTKQIKLNILDILEERVAEKPKNDDLSLIADIVIRLEEDKNAFSNMLGAVAGKGFSSGYNGQTIEGTSESAESK